MRSSGVSMRVRVIQGTIRLRPAPGETYATSIGPGEYEVVLLPTREWLNVPSHGNHGLTPVEWKDHWDELRVEVERKNSPNGWEPLQDEDDWKQYVLK